MRSLTALPQDAFELAVGLVMAHHPGLQPYDDFGFDLDALDALTLRQMRVRRGQFCLSFRGQRLGGVWRFDLDARDALRLRQMWVGGGRRDSGLTTAVRM